jgi:hypothetical protein
MSEEVATPRKDSLGTHVDERRESISKLRSSVGSY